MTDAVASSASAATPGAASRPASLLTRILIALAVGVASAAYVVVRARVMGAPSSDVDLIWASARALLAGLDPYAVVGPGGSFYHYPFHMYYPFTAVVIGIPMVPLPEAAVGPLFALVAGAALTLTLTRRGLDTLPVLISGAYLGFLFSVQWSPLLVAATVFPWLGWLLAVKPNVGLALWTYRASGTAAALVAAVVLVSLAVRPGWVADWREVLRYSNHFRAPVQHAGGVLLLLAALRWRRPEARLLLALGCMPHTTLAYETLPLALVPRTRLEAMVYALLTWPVFVGQLWLSNNASGGFVEQTELTGDLAVALVYLPCLIMVLRRPNEGELPAWWATLAARLRPSSPGTRPLASRADADER